MNTYCPTNCVHLGGYDEEVSGKWYCKALKEGLYDTYDAGATTGPNMSFRGFGCPVSSGVKPNTEAERDQLRAELAAAKELVRWRKDRKEPMPNHQLGYWLHNKADFLVFETDDNVYWLPIPPVGE